MESIRAGQGERDGGMSVQSQQHTHTPHRGYVKEEKNYRAGTMGSADESEMISGVGRSLQSSVEVKVPGKRCWLWSHSDNLSILKTRDTRSTKYN